MFFRQVAKGKMAAKSASKRKSVAGGEVTSQGENCPTTADSTSSTLAEGMASVKLEPSTAEDEAEVFRRRLKECVEPV